MIITVGGMPGAGKSTIAKMLAEELDIPRYYMGGIFRKIAAERGMDINEFYKVLDTDSNLEKEIDDYQVQLGKNEDNFLMEGRTSFHLIPDSLKIFFKVNPDIAVARVFQELQGENDRGEKSKTIEELTVAMNERLESGLCRYMALYRVDHMDEANYDIVIDTSDKSIEEVYQAVLGSIQEV